MPKQKGRKKRTDTLERNIPPKKIIEKKRNDKIKNKSDVVHPRSKKVRHIKKHVEKMFVDSKCSLRERPLTKIYELYLSIVEKYGDHLKLHEKKEGIGYCPIKLTWRVKEIVYGYAIYVKKRAVIKVKRDLLEQKDPIRYMVVQIIDNLLGGSGSNWRVEKDCFGRPGNCPLATIDYCLGILEEEYRTARIHQKKLEYLDGENSKHKSIFQQLPSQR